MTLSTSRQQFLAYESQNPEDIHYERKGGMFVTTCVCVSFIIMSIVVTALVGVIVYFITYFKLLQTSSEFWDDTEPFGHTGPPSPDLRLPSDIFPSFYRLKLKTDLEKSTFTGEVYITIRATKPVKKIILHAKDLIIKEDARLTEQIYEKVDAYHGKKKREAPSELPATVEASNATVSSPNSALNQNNTKVTKVNNTETEPKHDDLNVTTTNLDAANVIIDNVNLSNVTKVPITPVDTQVTHSSVRNIKIISVSQTSGDRLVILLANSLKTDVDYTLELSFEGNISNTLTGFYRSTYLDNDKNTRVLAVTQFEPVSARAAFPCFDEPAFKAKFEISIAHQANLTVLSNMKVASKEEIPETPNWQWTHFERSVNMSTYLVAYIICDFEHLETNYTSKDNIVKPIRIWARPQLINNAKYALSITPKLLEYYEEVFGVPYALDKLDLVAVPDFGSGAMENWGLITFRETALLYDEVDGVPREKKNVAVDVAHELAHQWFGNLVTMRWWTDLWLNEGFATYIEYIGVDKIEPEWDMFQSFSQDKMDLLRSDALKNTSPVSRRVEDASEISQKFDEISYSKGANLIRMLNYTISGELFHRGLVTYLNQWKYTNAEENDLWLAMTAATVSDPKLKELSVVKFMNSWTRQAGYPVVNVERNYETGEILFEQRLFTASMNPYKSMVDQIWQVPISFGTLGTASTSPQLWLNDRFTSRTVNFTRDDVLYVNVDAVGYYRVNYDIRNWELLRDALKSGKVESPITKAQLIDDAFNFAKVGQLNYSSALDLTTFVANGEDSKMVWEMVLNNLAFLKHSLKATPGYVYFQDFVKILIDKQLQKLNYGLDKPKDDNEAFLIENLVSWECNVETPRCLDWAKKQFDSWITQPDVNNNPIPNYLRPIVYNIVLRYGGRREFEFLWDVFQNSTEPSVKTLIISSLASVRDESLIAMLLEKSLTEIPKQYAASAWSLESATASRIAQDFLNQNWERVYNKFSQIDPFMLNMVFSSVYSGINTKEELDQLKSFATQHKAELLPMSQSIQKLIDIAQFRIGWIQTHAAPLQRWFKDYVQASKKTAVSVQNSTLPIPTNTEQNSTSDFATEGAVTTPAPVSTTPQTNVNSTL